MAINTQNEPLFSLAENKTEVATQFTGTFFLKSIIGGLFIGIGATSMIGIGTLTNSIGAGLSFSIGLILIIFTKSELATGNMLTMVFGGSPLKTLRVAALTTGGNFLGAVSFSLLVSITGFLTPQRLEFINHSVDGKVSAPFYVIFVKAILCNVMVCLAVYIGALTENPVAKIIVIMFSITVFVVCGWEHSIANMSIFTYGTVSEGINLLPLALYNLVFAWIGNFVGGVGLGYLFKKYKV